MSSSFAEAPQATRKLALAWGLGDCIGGGKGGAPRAMNLLPASGQLPSISWSASRAVPGGCAWDSHGAEAVREENQ